MAKVEGLYARGTSAGLLQNPLGIPHDSASRSATQLLPLGFRAIDEAGNEYTYVKAGAAINANDAVKLNGSALGYDDVQVTTNDDEVLFGVATAAFTIAHYGFVQTRGVVTCKVIVATAAGSALVPGATDGTLKLAVAASLPGKGAIALVTGVAAGSAIHLF